MNIPVSGQERDLIICPNTMEVCVFTNFCESKKAALDDGRETVPDDVPDAVRKAFKENFCAIKIGENLVAAAHDPVIPFTEAADTIQAARMVNRGQDPFPTDQ